MAEEIIKPRYRYELRARISSAGYRSIKDFAEAIGLGQSALSQIVTGYVLPGKKGQKCISKGLAITFAELRDLL